MDVTLQLIMDQFKELKSEVTTTTAELKTDMRALGAGQEALKSDIGNITEDKVGNCMSTTYGGQKVPGIPLQTESEIYGAYSDVVGSLACLLAAATSVDSFQRTVSLVFRFS
jgi:hypothetical protein